MFNFKKKVYESLFPWGLLNEQTFQGIDNINFYIYNNKFTKGRMIIKSLSIERYFLMILPQVHLRKPCYDFYFL